MLPKIHPAGTYFTTKFTEHSKKNTLYYTQFVYSVLILGTV